jgi:hypothetical protein
MYEIIMLYLEKKTLVPLICNRDQKSEVMDFVKGSEGKDPAWIIEQVEEKFDCREVESHEEDPFGVRPVVNPHEYVVYVNFNNGSNPSLFEYPTYEHARRVGLKFLVKNGSVIIYKKLDDDIGWGSMKLIESLNYQEHK